MASLRKIARAASMNPSLKQEGFKRGSRATDLIGESGVCQRVVAMVHNGGDGFKENLKES